MTDLPVQDTTRQLPGPDLFPWFKWGADNSADLKRRWLDGESANQIATALGCSRNAVIGKVHRFGLGAHSRVIALAAAERKASGNYAGGLVASIKSKMRKGDLERGATQRIRAKANEAKLPAWANADLETFNKNIPLAQRVTIDGLTHVTCRFPLGDPAAPEFFYCGALEANNMEGVPYCRVHRGFAYAGKSSAKPWLAGRP